jgi:ATP-binding cassette subfamily F protein 3
MLPAEVRNYLAKYGFSGDEVFERVETLSGGERGRLALAKLALSDANLLLLDEPTNHLDLNTQEVLQQVLAEYPGTILLVSHDRYLIDALATQIWEVAPEEEALRVFTGTYSEYRQARLAAAAQAPSSPLEAKRSALAERRVKPDTLSRNRRQQLEKKLAALEGQIHTLEREKALQEAKLANPPTDGKKAAELAAQYNRLQAALEPLLAEWEQLATRLQEDEA